MTLCAYMYEYCTIILYIILIVEKLNNNYTHIQLIIFYVK